MKLVSWIIGIGVVAVAIVRWALARQQRSTWDKTMHWASRMLNPMSRLAMKTGRKMMRGMVR